MARDVLKEELNELVKGDVIVDFWATWCGPCRVVSPLIDEIAEQNPDLEVVKVDIDSVDVATAEKFGVLSIPTVLRFKEGQEVGRVIGAIPKAQLLERLDLS